MVKWNHSVSFHHSRFVYYGEMKSKASFHHSRLLHTAIWQVFFFLLPSITDYCRLTLWMHMLVENATSPCGQSWERIFNKHSCIQFIALVPLALVLWTVFTGACGKPFPKIVPMVKLDIWYLALWQNWCLWLREKFKTQNPNHRERKEEGRRQGQRGWRRRG